MTKRFDFGTKNLNGNLIPAPFDGKSLRIDWLSDFMFEGCVVHNRQYCEEHLGFIQLYREVVGVCWNYRLLTIGSDIDS